MSLAALKAHLGNVATLTFTNGSGSQIDAGTERLESEKFGVVLDDTPDGEEGVMVVGTAHLGAGIDITRDTGDAAWSRGDAVYWDSANSQATTASADGDLIGYALEDTASGDATGRVALTNETPVT